MLELGRLYIPTSLEYNPETGKIKLRAPEFQSVDYFNDYPCNLILEIYGTFIHIDYQCEDDTSLSFKLNNAIDINFELDVEKEYDLSDVAHGDLAKESFQEIQNRALRKLAGYMDNADQQFAEHFDNI